VARDAGDTSSSTLPRRRAPGELRQRGHRPLDVATMELCALGATVVGSPGSEAPLPWPVLVLLAACMRLRPAVTVSSYLRQPRGRCLWAAVGVAPVGWRPWPACCWPPALAGGPTGAVPAAVCRRPPHPSSHLTGSTRCSIHCRPVHRDARPRRVDRRAVGHLGQPRLGGPVPLSRLRRPRCRGVRGGSRSAGGGPPGSSSPAQLAGGDALLSTDPCRGGSGRPVD
jgi:hypothetical protein